MFRTVPLSISRSFTLYTAMVYVIQLVSRIRMEMQFRPLQFRPDPAHKLSAKLYDVYHCCVQ